MQFVKLAEENKMLFEYAHVLMFATAVMYAKEIALISVQIGEITAAYRRQDNVDDSAVRRHSPQPPPAARSCRRPAAPASPAPRVSCLLRSPPPPPPPLPVPRPSPSPSTPLRAMPRPPLGVTPGSSAQDGSSLSLLVENEKEFVRRESLAQIPPGGEGGASVCGTKLSWGGALNAVKFAAGRVSVKRSYREEQMRASRATFHVLKFHFLGFMGLLTTKKFDWQEYLTKSMEKHIERKIDISTTAWFLLFAVVSASMLVNLGEKLGFRLMACTGWLLLLFECIVLARSGTVLDQLVEAGHAIRSQEADGGGSLTKRSSGEEEAEPRAEPRVAKAPRVAKSAAEMRMDELTAYVQARKTPRLMDATNSAMQRAQQSVKEAELPIKASALKEMGLLEHALQVTMLSQCMLQALIVTMLARDSILRAGVGGGLLLLLGMLLPTVISSKWLTPLVLQNFCLAHAVAVKQVDVLQEMEKEHEQSGDYTSAHQMLELAMDLKLTEADLHDEKLVRAKVTDLNKLGELKWRYRVVEEGQNPRDEAIKVLDEAKLLVETHITLESKHAPDPEAKKARSRLRRRPSVRVTDVHV